MPLSWVFLSLADGMPPKLASLASPSLFQSFVIHHLDFNCIGVPVFYFLSIHHKEKRFSYTSSPRKTFEENLEFYPVTRRAWNRAVAIRNAEIAQGAAAGKAE